MTGAEQLVRTLLIANGILAFAGIVGPALLFFWGRKFFADRGLTEAAEAGLKKDILQMESAVRQELNNGLSSSAAHSIQQYGSISTQLADIKRVIESAAERANEAHDRANHAVHLAELAENKITALDRLLNTRLDHIDTHIRGFEELLRSNSRERTAGRNAS